MEREHTVTLLDHISCVSVAVFTSSMMMKHTVIGVKIQYKPNQLQETSPKVKVKMV